MEYRSRQWERPQEAGGGGEAAGGGPGAILEALDHTVCWKHARCPYPSSFRSGAQSLVHTGALDESWIFQAIATVP